MARVKFGVAEDDKMFSFWEERLKMGDESAKDVYGFVLWEKYEPVNERSVSSLQSRARRIVPQFYQWNWKVGRKLAVYKMWQKSFTGDKATLHAIEKYCKVDITLYRDGTIKSWTRKSKSKPTMTSQEGGVAALKDAGSERIVIEDSDEEMQISEAVQPTKPNVTLCFSEDEVDEVVQPPKKKPKSTVSQPEIVQRVVAEPPKENAVVTAVDDAPGAVNPLDYTHVSLAELDTMNFTQIIESLKKTVNTNHETREFLGKPPISTPPHLKKSFNEITPLEPLMSGEKKKQNCVSFPNQPLFGNREELVQSKKADENDVGDRVVPAKQLNDVAPPRPETRTVSPPNTAPATCGRSPETIKVTPEIRNEAFSVAFKRLRECHKHITPENVPQFRAVERKIQADGLTLEQFCDKMAVDFVNLSALLMAETARSSTKVRLVPVPHLYVRAPQRLQIVTDIWNEFEKSTPTDKLPLIKNSIEGSELMILIMSLSEEQYADGMKDLAASLRQEFVYNSD